VATGAGLVAALLFTLMPVVVCMAHEGKPHLPGAVLMLLAVLFAMRHVSTARPGAEHRETVSRATRDFWLMCLCCGAAFGMVLSSLPIFVLIPLVVWLDLRRTAIALPSALARLALGIAVGGLVYLITNPYIVINAVANREVLQSNFGNSLAMYEIARIGEGFVRVLELTIEGAGLPILILGALALLVALLRMGRPKGALAGKPPVAPDTRHSKPSTIGNPQSAIADQPPGAPDTASVLVLAVPAAVFFLQFVLIGAGKPGEYGRFGIFTNTALAIGTAYLLTWGWHGRRRIFRIAAVGVVVAWTGFFGATYLRNFHADATSDGSRTRLASAIAGEVARAPDDRREVALAVRADPAPYALPPIDFSRMGVFLCRSEAQITQAASQHDAILVTPVDEKGSVDWHPSGDAPNGSAGLDQRAGPPRPQERSWLGRLWHRPTPISWANKPFRVEGR
jgi:hypothetical protein